MTHFVAKETTRYVDFFAPHDDNFLARENVLGDYGSQPTKKMTLPIDDNGCRRKYSHGNV